MYIDIHIYGYISSGDQVLLSHARLPSGCVVHLTAAWPVCNCMESKVCNGLEHIKYIFILQTMLAQSST